MLHRPMGFLKTISKCGNKGSSVNAVHWYLLFCSPTRSRLWKMTEHHAVWPRVISRTKKRKKASQPLQWSELTRTVPQVNCIVQMFTKDLENERNGEVAKFFNNT